jgi:Xrn1 SH3-like domain
MVQESGAVPLSAKGVVIGLNTRNIDVVWDVPCISGTTLNGRCSEYRGSTIEFNACLNLTNQQFVSTVDGTAQPPPPPLPPIMANGQPRSRFGSQPPSSRSGGQRAQPSTWEPRPHARFVVQAHTVLKESDCMFSGLGSSSAPVHIMTNPNRGRGAAPMNGHGPTPSASKPNGMTWRPAPATSAEDQDSDSPQGRVGGYQQDYRKPPMPPRGGYNMRSRGRGYSGPGRGGNRGGGGHRGRGRGMAAPLAS